MNVSVCTYVCVWSDELWWVMMKWTSRCLRVGVCLWDFTFFNIMGHRKVEMPPRKHVPCSLASTEGMPLLHFIQIHICLNFASVIVGWKRKERKRKKNNAPWFDTYTHTHIIFFCFSFDSFTSSNGSPVQHSFLTLLYPSHLFIVHVYSHTHTHTLRIPRAGLRFGHSIFFYLRRHLCTSKEDKIDSRGEWDGTYLMHCLTFAYYYLSTDSPMLSLF